MTKPDSTERIVLSIVPGPSAEETVKRQRARLKKVRDQVRKLIADPKLNTADRLLDALWQYSRDD